MRRRDECDDVVSVKVKGDRKGKRRSKILCGGEFLMIIDGCAAS